MKSNLYRALFFGGMLFSIAANLCSILGVLTPAQWRWTLPVLLLLFLGLWIAARRKKTELFDLVETRLQKGVLLSTVVLWAATFFIAAVKK